MKLAPDIDSRVWRLIYTYMCKTILGGFNYGNSINIYDEYFISAVKFALGYFPS